MVYTAGFADMMDRTGHYVLSLASFDATTGRLNTVKNLTSVDTFAMGYGDHRAVVCFFGLDVGSGLVLTAFLLRSVDATRDQVFFSAQHHIRTGGLDDVEIYTEKRCLSLCPFTSPEGTVCCWRLTACAAAGLRGAQQAL